MATLTRRYKIVGRYGASNCTRCGKLDLCTKPIREYWKGIPLTISLCRKCSRISIKLSIDQLIEGVDQQTQIDKLTQYGQR